METYIVDKELLWDEPLSCQESRRKWIYNRGSRI
jgi:hypothetical protein